jgi:hydrogenase expression/formation protein HypC
MCLSIPMQVTQVDGLKALCHARGADRVVSLVLLMDLDVQPGDMVTVHQGCAIERIPAERAQQAWALYDEMLARADARPDSGSAPMAD